jgi:hypothetical protein
VEDSANRNIPAATVMATQLATGQRFKTVTSVSGIYDLPELPIGAYRVTYSAQGFQEDPSSLTQFDRMCDMPQTNHTSAPRRRLMSEGKWDAPNSQGGEELHWIGKNNGSNQTCGVAFRSVHLEH